MGKTKSTREGNGGDMGAAGSSLRAAVRASELRKRKRAAETKKRTPPRSERGRRGKTASRPAREDRRSGRRRPRPARRTPRGVRPPLPPPPPLRLLPRPAPLRGSVLANIRRRPASAVDEGEGGSQQRSDHPERGASHGDHRGGDRTLQTPTKAAPPERLAGILTMSNTLMVVACVR